MSLYKNSMLLYWVRERRRSKSRLIERFNKRKKVVIVSSRKRKEERRMKIANNSRLNASSFNVCRVRWSKSVKLCLKREDKSANTFKKCCQKTRDREIKLKWIKKLPVKMTFKLKKNIPVCLISKRTIAIVNLRSVSKELNCLWMTWLTTSSRVSSRRASLKRKTWTDMSLSVKCVWEWRMRHVWCAKSKNKITCVISWPSKWTRKSKESVLKRILMTSKHLCGLVIRRIMSRKRRD